MILCVALDDNNGMMFNNRRQSQDKVLREHLVSECGGNKLWMNEYTSKQFETPMQDNIVVDEEFLNKAGEGEYCFVENLSVASCAERIEKVIVFKWNRVYPADMWFDLPLSENGWQFSAETEFEGSSHEKITKEVWLNEI